MEIKKIILEYDLKDDLPLSYGHKLRGFFAHKFDHVLFHHHKDDGSLRYQYPLIQYKIIDNNPVIIALQKGCKIVSDNFLDVEILRLGGKIYNFPTGKLTVEEIYLEVKKDYEMFPYSYNFISPWMALNQKNYKVYTEDLESQKEKNKFLAKIITGNILAFAKGVDWWVENKIVVMPDLNEIMVNFKGNKMLAFKGKFYSNVCLPDYIGLGKSSSRGFGTIEKNIIE
jgi:hypothetical protein